AGLGRALVMPAELSFSARCVSNIWIREVCVCIVKIASNDVAGEACGVERACCWLGVGGYDGVILSNATKEDSQFARRMGVLIQEMEAAYDERADFIKELEVVSGVDVAVKTAEFLNDALWKDERRLQREITDDLRLAREINALCALVTAIFDKREMFVNELDMLARKHVPDKMAEFMKQVQGKDIPNLMKLQILERKFELKAQKKEFSLRS
nr:hypothetical protein [Tanacetum cinerariifolium]